MCSDVVVVTSIGSQGPAQMRLTKNENMIRALAADRPDQPFGKAILPRRGCCGRLVPDAHGAQSACDDGTIDAIPIADEVFWGIIPRKRLGHLTRNPIRCRVCSDIDPDEVSAVEADDHEGVEQAKANGRNNEQIHRGNVRRVVTQERSPFLAWRSTAPDHVLGDAGLGHLKPELEEFSVNAWRAPKRIFDAYPPDQRAGPPRSAAALPMIVTSSASSCENQPDANAQGSRDG